MMHKQLRAEHKDGKINEANLPDWALQSVTSVTPRPMTPGGGSKRPTPRLYTPRSNDESQGGASDVSPSAWIVAQFREENHLDDGEDLHVLS